MCAANDPGTFDFDFGYQTIPGLTCNVWHRPPVPPDFGGKGYAHEFGVIDNSFCMSRNPYDRLSSQYRYKSGLQPDKFPATCDAFGRFLDNHLTLMQNNDLVRCLHKGVVSPTECQYHIRARLTREAKLTLEEIDAVSTYGDEDCHFLPQTMYTRACQNVFKLEEYDQSVAPFLEANLNLEPGSAAAGEKAYSQVVDPMAGASTAGAATGSLGEGKAALGAASSSRKKSTRAPAGVRNNAWKDDDEWAAQRDEAAKAWWSAQQKSGDVGGLGEEEEEEEEGYADDDDYDYDDYDYDEEELEELEAASDPRSALAFLVGDGNAETPGGSRGGGGGASRGARARRGEGGKKGPGVLSGAWAQSFGEVVRPARIEPPERYVAPRPKGEPIREYREPPIEEYREPPIEEAREKPASPRASAASRAAEKPADPEASDPEKTSPRAKSKRSARATEGRREATPKAAEKEKEALASSRAEKRRSREVAPPRARATQKRRAKKKGGRLLAPQRLPDEDIHDFRLDADEYEEALAAEANKPPPRPRACEWADMRPETLALLVDTYAEDFQELGYSSAPPPGVIDLGAGTRCAHSAASLGVAADANDVDARWREVESELRARVDDALEGALGHRRPQLARGLGQVSGAPEKIARKPATEGQHTTNGISALESGD